MPYLKAKHLTNNLKSFNKASDKDNRKLIYAGEKLRFQSEMDLEDYIEENFEKIFTDLILVKRQFGIKMQRCDLLCSHKISKQPVLIELKNEEDRGLVSQLIRYRKALLLEMPFENIIDYSLPVNLIAIAPIFHEDNYTDKESSKFEDNIYFYEFSLELNNQSGLFKIDDCVYDIPYPIFGLSKNRADDELSNITLPAFTSNFRSKLPQECKYDFTNLRALLMAQPNVKEMVSTTYRKVLYGTGEGQNHKKIAEITNTGKGIYLFLWLPTNVKTNIKIPVARYGFILAKDSNPFSENSIVDWLVCTKTTIDPKNKPENHVCSSFNRHGMPIWTKANHYLSQASLGSLNTFHLFLYLLKGMKPPIDEDTYQWWKSYEKKTPDNLGWYVDLAIKTWNFRIK
ncbi:hypothetical protein H6G33_06265 [Calothrix sp. FACHB-1219]|uniref:hypothetical protein n=1 Tax=unclassified Calothrix TaxID=2619626 RepID=UPI0016849474|nr:MULTISPECIES: hypothetical protein [unclassified Calothrix]MBD2205226.1 hypothetical protein [Calothrix sp. FACHB-168]MBD2216632.1 hypothetical protein [Calothrix sp. FACHB-1219]